MKRKNWTNTDVQGLSDVHDTESEEGIGDILLFRIGLVHPVLSLSLSQTKETK